MAAFAEVGLMPELIRAVEDLGWMLPTPIQSESVPLILGGGDIMAAAETGSGKTGAFALPILQIVHEALRKSASAGRGVSQSNGSSQQNVRCQLNVQDRDAVFAISPDGLRCQSRAPQSWAGCRATVGVFAGKVYYEAKVTDEGLCRIGWSTQASKLDGLGFDAQSFGYGGTGKKSHKRRFDDYGELYGLGDTIGCMFDSETMQVSYSKNGQDLGVAFSVTQNLQGQVFYPTICLKNAEMAVNFGETAFEYDPPPGFVGIAKAPPSTTATAMDPPRSAHGGERRPLCIILEPARDLAEQTHDCITDFGKYLKAPTVANALFVGGVDAKAQARALREGVDIVTGTPGRITDFINSGKLSVDKVRFFVLDEADRLLDTGNQPAIMQLFRQFPKSGKGMDRLQVLMFSATLHSEEVKQLSSQICQNPIVIDLKGKGSVPDTVDHVIVRADPHEDRTWLQTAPKVPTDNVHVLDSIGPNISTKECYSEAVKRLKPRILRRIIDAHKMDQCLIFCRTNFDCDNLETFLNQLGGGQGFRGRREHGKENPYSCAVLAGARNMHERRMALECFKAGEVRFLICTDVAARGIDIRELPYVINMTLPDRSEDYIHRVGRVGRADTMGLAISIVSTVPEKVWYCSVKGYRPWLEPDAENTRTNKEGGHTVWYDESQYLKDIEARIGHPIDTLGPDMSLPASIQARSTVAYGQQRGGGDTSQAAEHMQQIRQSVEQLARLEWEAQTSFLTLGRKFGTAR